MDKYWIDTGLCICGEKLLHIIKLNLFLKHLFVFRCLIQMVVDLEWHCGNTLVVTSLVC